MLRAADYATMLFFILCGALCFYRKSWVRPVLFCIMLICTLLWVDTTITLLKIRLALEEPWLRAAAILTGITLLSFGSGCQLLSASARHFYGNTKTATFQALIVLLSGTLLFTLHIKAPLPLLLADRFSGFGLPEIFFLCLYAAWLAGKMYSPAGAFSTRPRIWLFFSLIFFLQLLIGLAGVEQALMTGKLHLPIPALIIGGPLYRGGGYFMPILLAVTLVLTGPAWCSHLCYIGAWDDILSRQKTTPAKALSQRRILAGRLCTLLITAITALLFRLVEVPPLTAAFAAAFFGLTGIGIMVTLSKKYGRMIHCTTFCPIGLITALAGKIAPWRLNIRRNAKLDKAIQHCRYSALNQNSAQKGKPEASCTLCLDCIALCRKDDITLQAPFLTPTLSRKIYTGMLVVLHVLFLAVARI
jgi:ferredoxin